MRESDKVCLEVRRSIQHEEMGLVMVSINRSRTAAVAVMADHVQLQTAQSSQVTIRPQRGHTLERSPTPRSFPKEAQHTVMKGAHDIVPIPAFIPTHPHQAGICSRRTEIHSSSGLEEDEDNSTRG
jgi:hypothetical protein